MVFTQSWHAVGMNAHRHELACALDLIASLPRIFTNYAELSYLNNSSARNTQSKKHRTRPAKCNGFSTCNSICPRKQVCELTISRRYSNPPSPPNRVPPRRIRAPIPSGCCCRVKIYYTATPPAGKMPLSFYGKGSSLLSQLGLKEAA